MTSNGRKIQEQILALLGSANYRPLNKSELAKALGRKSGVRMGLSQVLRDLERAGEIARIRKNRYVLPPAADLIAGKLHIHQAGYGFLISEKPGESDIFIAAENTGTAMHGDRVVARISRDEPHRRIKGRREGRVIRILERAHDTIVGTLQRSRNFYYVVPDDPRFVHDVYVASVAPVPDRRRSQPAATSAVTTSMPSRRSRAAIAAPSPRAAPVTSAFTAASMRRRARRRQTDPALRVSSSTRLRDAARIRFSSSAARAACRARARSAGCPSETRPQGAPVP